MTPTREQTPLTFGTLPSRRGSLLTGDYSVEGSEDHFTVERKTMADLVASLTSGRERFFNELHRLRGFAFKRLLVVGSRREIEEGSYRSRANPKAVLASLHAIEIRFDVPVVFAHTPEEAARLIERWAWFWWREVRKRAGLEAEPCPPEILGLPVTASCPGPAPSSTAPHAQSHQS